MQATDDDFKPRRDGWFEHWGLWSEVTVGTILADPTSRTKRWEVIAQAHGAQVEFGQTLWMRAREATSGQEVSVRPHSQTARVKLLTQSPQASQTPDPTPPSDAEAIRLLIAELGAEVLASQDPDSGEWTCPDYIYESHIPGHGDRQVSRGLIEHLRFAHATSVDDDTDIATLTTLHGQAHNPKHPDIGKGGFPHRHHITA